MSPGMDPAAQVPGTYVFDSAHGRAGYPLNSFCHSLGTPANRAAFQQDEAGYCARFALSSEQMTAVLERDWKAMLDLGGSIFYIYKLAATDGLSMQHLGGVFTGMSREEFTQMMRAGGRAHG
jgi:protocatechuate 4,5-dioxygenase alpha subunit